MNSEEYRNAVKTNVQHYQHKCLCQGYLLGSICQAFSVLPQDPLLGTMVALPEEGWSRWLSKAFDGRAAMLKPLLVAFSDDGGRLEAISLVGLRCLKAELKSSPMSYHFGHHVRAAVASVSDTLEDAFLFKHNREELRDRLNKIAATHIPTPRYDLWTPEQLDRWEGALSLNIREKEGIYLDKEAKLKAKYESDRKALADEFGKLTEVEKHELDAVTLEQSKRPQAKSPPQPQPQPQPQAQPQETSTLSLTLTSGDEERSEETGEEGEKSDYGYSFLISKYATF